MHSKAKKLRRYAESTIQFNVIVYARLKWSNTDTIDDSFLFTEYKTFIQRKNIQFNEPFSSDVSVKS